MNECVHASRVLGWEVLSHIEARHLPGNRRRKEAGIKAGDARDTRSAIDDTVPCLGDSRPNRRDNAQAGDDDSAFGQTKLRYFRGKL